jgi:transcription elongation factor Elf1
MNVKCPICGREKELRSGELFKDNLGIFTECRCCDAKYDIRYDKVDKNYVEIILPKYTAKYEFKRVS